MNALSGTAALAPRLLLFLPLGLFSLGYRRRQDPGLLSRRPGAWPR